MDENPNKASSPPVLTWHHHEDVGRLVLVDRVIMQTITLFIILRVKEDEKCGVEERGDEVSWMAPRVILSQAERRRSKGDANERTRVYDALQARRSIIKIVQEGYIKDNFCLYTKEYEAIATLELTCYLERYPEVSDDDEEVYPDYVEQNELELFFYGDQFMDVLRSALNQKPSATVDELISALNYYLENDAFITFSRCNNLRSPVKILLHF